MATPADQPNAVELADGIYVPESVLQFTYARSSGPGGQNVNKVNTKATLTIQLADLAAAMPGWAMEQLHKKAGHYLAENRLVISSDESRSQRTNRDTCVTKLCNLVEQAMKRPKVRRKRKPSKRMIQRRIDEKKARGRLKADRRTNRGSGSNGEGG